MAYSPTPEEARARVFKGEIIPTPEEWPRIRVYPQAGKFFDVVINPNKETINAAIERLRNKYIDALNIERK